MHRFAKGILRLGAVVLLVATLFAAFVYAAFSVLWLHAPALPALALSAGLASPFVLLSWALHKLAGRTGLSATSNGS